MPVYTRAQLRSTFVHELSPPLSSLISVLPRSNVPRGRAVSIPFSTRFDRGVTGHGGGRKGFDSF